MPSIHLRWLAAMTLVAACGDHTGDIVPPGTPDGSTPPDATGGLVDAPPLPGDPDADLPDAMEEPDDPAYLFDLAALHHFDIAMDPQDWQWLKANAELEEYRPGTLIFEDRQWTGVGVRFKGSFGTLGSCFDDQGTQICPKLSIKVKVNFADEDSRFYSMRRVVFNSSIRDKSFMREVVAYHLFRSMGLPAPRASHATLAVNGEPQGLFVLVEDIDKEFIQDHWTDDEGNLYKAAWPQHASAGKYQSALETNESTGDVSRMLELYQRIEASNDLNFPANVSGLLDLDELARYLAVDRAVRHVDSIRTFRCFTATQTAQDCVNGNYYWYEDPQGVTELIAWDVDHTFEGVDTDLGRSYFQQPPPFDCVPTPYCVYFNKPDCDPATDNIRIIAPQCNRFYGLMHRATWNDYLTALDDLVYGPMAPQDLLPLVAMLRAKIEDAVAADPFGPGAAVWDDYADYFEGVLANQVAAIQSMLDEQSP